MPQLKPGFSTRLLVCFLVCLSPSGVVAEQNRVSITNVTYIVEDDIPGLGIKAELAEWIEAEEMNGVATEICNAVAPEVLPQFQDREDLEMPVFIEVDAKVPRSFGFMKFNAGHVRRFSYRDGTCAPSWEEG